MAHPLEAAAIKMMKEAFEGPLPPARQSWFVNTEPDSGIFGMLKGIRAGEASKEIHGTNLAAHTDHIRYHLWGCSEVISGRSPRMDWLESWRIKSVDEERWQEIQDQLRDEYLRFLAGIEQMEWTGQRADEALATIIHAAYHLGAMKQMLKSVGP
ncbi:hypothetical protein V1498_02100 [Peribacillus sp. SCS-26]|uniref:hypothetical protein n=1 Tax=Paraperibacillus marinus TaxID=3115295 RepID=UPI00390584F3